MSRYIFDRAALLMKKESESGSYIEADIALPLERGAGVLDIEVDKKEYDPMSATLGAKENTVVTTFAKVPIEVKSRLGSVKTPFDVMLSACGMSESTEDNVSTFKFDSSNFDTFSFKQIAQREITKAKGARGDFSISATAGEAVEISFNFNALLVGQDRSSSDNTIPASPMIEPVFLSNNCNDYLLNGNAADVEKIEFKLNADITTAKSSCSNGAYTQDIKPELTITLNDTIASSDSFDDLKSGKVFNVVLPFFDINGTKKWEIIIPKGVVIEHKKPAEDGRIKIERTLECRPTNGDDNFFIKYYG